MAQTTPSAETGGRETISRERLAGDLARLGVRPGDLLNVKVSMKSIGWVEGGAKTLIDALLDVVGPEGTLITDSFVSAYALPLSPKHAAVISDQDSPSYAGALANAMRAYPGACRSPHPIQKFVGIGREAEALTRAHTIDSPPYHLLSKMAAGGGRNVKIGSDQKVAGVGTTHVAIEELEIIRRRPPIGVNYRADDGSIKLYEVNWSGACEVAWWKFYPDYERIGAILGVDNVGQAPSKLTDMKKTLAWEIEHIRKDPRVLMCDRASCRTCRLEWEFSNGNKLAWAVAHYSQRLVGKARRVLSGGAKPRR